MRGVRTTAEIIVAFPSAKSAALRTANGAEATLNDSAVLICVMAVLVWLAAIPGVTDGPLWAEDAQVLPAGVQVDWDLQRAYRETTATRERICLNGLWQFQPASADARQVPENAWGYFKVPGSWPGITDYMQKDCQTVFLHSSWSDRDVSQAKAAWYQRELVVPTDWPGRRIVLQAEYVNSLATVFVDGQPAGEIRYPGGELDVTRLCRPGEKQKLSLLVVAVPLQGVMLSYSDTAAAKEVEGRVERRGLCGDVYLSSEPPGPRFEDVQIVTSYRKSAIELSVALSDIVESRGLEVQARVLDGDRLVHQFSGSLASDDNAAQGRFVIRSAWRPDKLWDLHTPENQYQLAVTLRNSAGELLDERPPVRFGFREFWIDGRDFYLNGTRVFLSSVPIDSAQVGAAWASYEGARESLQRLASFGINFVYTHNYGCEPGSHLSFSEILRAADDTGMLVAFSQPHFSHYEWDAPTADTENGYARHAEFYVRAAQNHPAVVAYSTSHNATGYGEDMNPDMTDGRQASRNEWSLRNVRRAMRAEAIIQRLDPSRVVYHHASGNLGAIHNSNFYANFVPIQEMSDWFEHWSREGVKPLFTCEYSVPMPWDWAMYRGWYRGKREFGSAVVPWELCIAEWNAQFYGDRAYQISDEEAADLRWEARQYAQGRLWHRWDYPHQIGSSDFLERYPVYARYFADNWPAFRAWEVSANSPWNHSHYWILRPGVNKDRQPLKVNWADLQRPGFSADYLDQRYETMEMAYECDDWVATEAAQTLMRYNRPLLGCLIGKVDAHTSKDHLFRASETVEKQLLVINNSRQTVRCNYQWSLALPELIQGGGELELPTGEQRRVAVRCALPVGLPAGPYMLQAAFRFSTGELQTSQFQVDVLPPCESLVTKSEIGLFDPIGETGQWLRQVGVKFVDVTSETDLSATQLLIIGKGAITVDGTLPDLSRVRDGLKVVVFEQTPEALEQRLGFRVAAYGLREVFSRVPEHPVLRGIGAKTLCDWRGAGTILPSRLDYMPVSHFSDAPTVRWCGIPVARAWRCGNRGNVASVLIERPACGDFLSLVDGGFSLQYSPLLEYREGAGMVLFCQLDVTGRTEEEPVADQLRRNLLTYVDTWRPAPQRRIIYTGDRRWKTHLQRAGFSCDEYSVDKLDERCVLVVGPGGGSRLARDKQALATWLEGNGRVLCLGLDAREVGMFLSTPLETRRAEHISCWFEPLRANSLLVGIGPADVHQAAPVELPLVSGGPAVVGDGILAVSADQKVVFCQFDPDQVDRDWLSREQLRDSAGTASPTAEESVEPRNLKRTYRRISCLISRLLGNLGAAAKTPLLQRFEPIDDPSVGRWLKGLYLDRPAEWDDPYRFFRW